MQDKRAHCGIQALRSRTYSLFPRGALEGGTFITRSGQLFCGDLVKSILQSHQYGEIKSPKTNISGKNARLTVQTDIHSSVEDWILLSYLYIDYHKRRAHDSNRLRARH